MRIKIMIRQLRIYKRKLEYLRDAYWKYHGKNPNCVRIRQRHLSELSEKLIGLQQIIRQLKDFE